MEKTLEPRRYLAVFMPLLPAERVIKERAAPLENAFALTEKVCGGVRLAAVDAHALALGIAPGLTLADARARLPGLAAFEHDPAADGALLNWLADTCDRYSPMVAIDPPQGIVINISGCVHPFGSERSLAVDLEKRFLSHGLTGNTALADTPDAALALAAFGSGDVHALPVTALRVDSEVHHALRRAGLKTIGHLARRPRAPLAARFGSAMTSRLARLLGEEDVGITSRRQPPEVQVDQRCIGPVTRSDAVLDVLDRLIREAMVTLAGRGSGGRLFEAALFRTDGYVARLAVETSHPTRDANVIARLFGERIETLADTLDPGFGYDLIRLAIPVAEALAPLQLPLEGGAVAGVDVTVLVDRLASRMGRNRVRRFSVGDSHIPEQAAFEFPAGDPLPRAVWPVAQSGEPPLRPICLFDLPQRVEVIASVPDGPPLWFRWRRSRHNVIRAEGPERIAAEWWRRRSGNGLTRDYYRIEDRYGRCFWVFRHGLYGVEAPMPGWYLHGMFA